MKILSITENIPTPDEVTDRVTKYLASRKHIKAPPIAPKQNTGNNEWHREQDHKEQSIRDRQAFGESPDMPEPGDNIRTRKTKMEGKVKKVNGNMVLFQLVDGRMMKTSINNVIVIEKLADEDDEIMEDELNEISNEVLARYKTAAGKDASAADKAGDFKKGNKRFSGIVKATNKQFDNNKKQNIKEIDMSNFADILNNQHKETPVVPKKQFKKMLLSNKNYFVVYTVPSSNLHPVEWVIKDAKTESRMGDVRKSSDLKAVLADAEEWLATRSGVNTASNSVTINFNASFARQFADNGETVYCDIWDGPTLVFSTTPQEGFNKTSIRTENKGGNAALLPVTVISAKKANEAKLDGNSRYTLGPKDDMGDGVLAFPLVWHGKVEAGVRVPMREPIIQTSTERPMTEEGIETPHSNDPADTVTVDVPLLIRIMEYAKEDAKTDLDLHNVAEKLIGMSREGRTLTMDDYDAMVGEVKEGTMGGINRSAPATDVSYERMLDDVYDTWMGDRVKVKESYGAPLKGSYDTRLKQIMKSK